MRENQLWRPRPRPSSNVEEEAKSQFYRDLYNRQLTRRKTAGLAPASAGITTQVMPRELLPPDASRRIEAERLEPPRKSASGAPHDLPHQTEPVSRPGGGMWPTAPRNSAEFSTFLRETQRMNQDLRGGSAYDARTDNVSQTYLTRRFNFLSELEGVELRAYDDVTGKPITPNSPAQGNITVGVGFNMDRPDAREVFTEILDVDGSVFDRIYSGEQQLTPAQVRRLFDYTAAEAEQIVQNTFKGRELSSHQRIALVSLAFNHPDLIGPNLTAFVKAGDIDGAIDEILYRSNAKKIKGLANRRYKEALMFMGPLAAKEQGFVDYETYIRTALA